MKVGETLDPAHMPFAPPSKGDNRGSGSQKRNQIVRKQERDREFHQLPMETYARSTLTGGMTKGQTAREKQPTRQIKKLFLFP